MIQPAKADLVEFIQSGKAFFDAAKKIINDATEVIHLQTYIFSFDETGKDIANHLMLAAKRGVKVYLLVDGFGSKDLPKTFMEELKAAGVFFRFFAPIISSENISIARRIHHKLLVADKYTALIGGINIGDKYNNLHKNIPWLDFAVLIKGNCNLAIHSLCERIYFKNKKKYIHTKTNGEITIRFRRNDWFKQKKEIYNSYKKGIVTSKKSITMFASYFLPGYFFIRLLKKAAKKGVKIKIVVGGMSDVALFHYAEKYLYPTLIKSGIEIYEWPHSVMHGKVAVFDESLATIGSYNLNNLSKYNCIELNVNIENTLYCKKISNDLVHIINQQCNKITQNNFAKNSNVFVYLKSFFAYYLYKFLMYLIAPKA